MELTDNTVLTFGKYKKKTIGYVLERDPDYLLWMQDNIDDVFFNPDIQLALNNMVDIKEFSKRYDGLEYFDTLG